MENNPKIILGIPGTWQDRQAFKEKFNESQQEFVYLGEHHIGKLQTPKYLYQIEFVDEHIPYFATVVSGATENHLNGNISPGEKQSGIAIFDTPKEGDFKFEFSGFSKNRGIWTFTQEDIQPAQ
ncbi:hypothetical protein QJ133_03435 [Priestia megaterium]|uniref:hypothetical protein n=1 Tax=Priestia megaterium TaxID=1404 RepID=UPI00249A4655|nr:hypothetical protein [Priestia megaterium]MDI3090224.1 hypothetical protein [Priestia megaterium]